MLRQAALFLCLAAPAAPAWAESLCKQPATPEVLETLVGSWSREGAISLFNETMDQLKTVPQEARAYQIAPDLTLNSTYIDNVAGAPQPIRGLEVPAYDVDGVDDLLETVARADLADILSDTPCGPETLPQWQVVLMEQDAAGISVAVTMTVIGYFSDRLLMLTEAELKSDAAVIFMTEAMLLRPDVK